MAVRSTRNISLTLSILTFQLTRKFFCFLTLITLLSDALHILIPALDQSANVMLNL